MAKRRTSGFEEVVDVISSFPWWVGTSLAIVSFLALHAFGDIGLTKPRNLNQFGSFAGKQLYVTLAYFGQFVFPPAFLLGAIISLIKSSRRKQIYGDVKRQTKPESLLDLTWKEFEELVGEYFRNQGYAIKHKGGNGPDGGVDLVLTKGNEKFLVQCKQWKAYKVGVQVVRELYGVDGFGRCCRRVCDYLG